MMNAAEIQLELGKHTREYDMSNPTRSAAVLAEILTNSQKLRELAAQDPEVMVAISNGLTKYLPTPAFVNDANIYLVVVISLGVVAISAILGVICLAYGVAGTVQIPETVTALGSAAIGALAGLLTPSPGSRG